MLGGLPKEYVDAVAHGILGAFIPDLTLVFTVQQEVAQARIGGRKTQEPADRLDAFDSSVHARIDAGFLQLVKEQWPYPGGKIPTRIVIDAGGSLESVGNQVALCVQKHFGVTL